MSKTKKQVRDELNLDRLPDDEFMRLLAATGENPIVAGPRGVKESEYTPERVLEEVMEALVVEGHLGALLAIARERGGQSLSQVAQRAGVTRARVQQLEQSENMEIATLLRLAGSLGYWVDIRLTPTDAARKPLELHLPRVSA